MVTNRHKVATKGHKMNKKAYKMGQNSKKVISYIQIKAQRCSSETLNSSATPQLWFVCP